MRVICYRHFARAIFGHPSHLPSRPDPKFAVRWSGLQQQGRIDALKWARGGVISLWAMARLVAGAPCLFAIQTLPVFEGRSFAQATSRSEPADRFAGLIAEASARFLIPARWIRAVMEIESGADEHARSVRGAMGLMQIMPDTWIELSDRYRFGIDPFEPRDNILAGAAYLKEMYDRFGSAGFLAAYHAGPSRYEQHLATGRPLPPDTVAYVATVTPLLAHAPYEPDALQRAVPWRQGRLFVERDDTGDGHSAPDSRRESPSTARLTAASSTQAKLQIDLFIRPSTESPSR
jgi:hypothetical protein